MQVRVHASSVNAPAITALGAAGTQLQAVCIGPSEAQQQPTLSREVWLRWVVSEAEKRGSQYGIGPARDTDGRRSPGVSSIDQGIVLTAIKAPWHTLTAGRDVQVLGMMGALLRRSPWKPEKQRCSSVLPQG